MIKTRALYAWLLYQLAAGDLSLGRQAQRWGFLSAQDSTDTDPSIRLYVQYTTASWIGSTYASLSPDDLSAEELQIVKRVCQNRDWHTWIGITDEDMTEPEEWWPTYCKPISENHPQSPVPWDYVEGEVFFIMPMALLRESYGGTGLFVIRADTEEYTGQNQVCKAGHHFHTQYFPSSTEGRPPQEDDGVTGRPVEASAIPSEILDLFENDIDPCTFILHPCWCERAPPAWKCQSCQMTETFSSRWLCYGEDFADNKAWCDAATVERKKGEANRPVGREEYERLLKVRELNATSLQGRDIHWLSDI